MNPLQNIKSYFQRLIARWLDIPALLLISRTAAGFGRIDGSQKAAGVAYYALLSLFPLLLGLIALFGYLLPTLNIQDELLKFVGNNLPGFTDIIKQNLVNIIGLRGIVGILSVILLFWSGSTMFSSISLAINRAWNIQRVRPFYIRKTSELLMVIATGILFLISLGATAAISILGGVFNLPAANLLIVNLGGRFVAFLLMIIVFLLLYKLLPNTRTYWKYIWPGALFSAVLFEIARSLFMFYLVSFANYQLIYGSISSIIILLICIYYSAFILILGAEFAFQYDRLRRGNPLGEALL